MWIGMGVDDDAVMKTRTSVARSSTLRQHGPPLTATTYQECDATPPGAFAGLCDDDAPLRHLDQRRELGPAAACGTYLLG